jgi:Glycosyltransferase family 9 (heptosyltransferase)
VAALNAAGFGVTLLAPASSGPALVGPGPAEARALVAWDRPDLASLFAEEALPPSVHELLGGFDLVLACTRNQRLVDHLSSLNATVVARDPQPPPGAAHAGSWLAASLSAAGIPEAPSPVPLLAATPEEGRGAGEWLDRLPADFIAIHPGSGSPSKNWPASHFAELLDGWPGHPFLLIEGPADAAAAEVLRSRPGAVVAHDIGVRVLGALLARAGLFVGNDSGVTHLAAAFGAPTLALFGPTDPGLWSPLGPRVRVVRAPDERLDHLRVDAVREAAQALLANFTPSS